MIAIKNAWKQVLTGTSQGVAFNEFSRAQVIVCGVLFSVISYGVALF